MKPVVIVVPLGCAVLLAAGWACSGAGANNPLEEPDAMLKGSPDAPVAEDGGDGGFALSTSVRFAHLVPGLGPITLCVQAPGSTSWTPLPTASSGDGGTEAGGGEEGGAGDAGVDGGRDSGLDADAGKTPKDAGGMKESSVDSTYPDGGPTTDGRVADGAASDAPHAPDAPDAPDAPAPDAGAPGAALPPLAMTAYVKLDAAGTYQVAVLPAGFRACTAAPLVQPVTLDSDQYTTVVLAQTRTGDIADLKAYAGHGADAAPLPFGLLSYRDDHASVSGQARTRLINTTVAAAPDAAASALSAALVDTTANVFPLASVVPADNVSSPSQVPPVVDALGYHDADPMTGPCMGPSDPGCLALRIAAVADGGMALPWTSVAGDLGVGPGSVHTAFIVSAATQTYEVLWCNDFSQQLDSTPCLLLTE